LFVIRTLFLGFIQKKGWLGSEKFIQKLWQEYKACRKKDEFYSRWLEPLFFESLNSCPGTPIRPNDNEFSKETEKTLQMAPFLNGELFKRKEGVDDRDLYLPDEVIEEFFEFLFQYNFTINENTAYDEELELNPEFLGIIFEKFVNKDQGSVYTPRTEVDMMGRLSLLRWLAKKDEFELKELYYLFFREGGKGDEFKADQKEGNFSENEIRKLVEYLENVTVCDPAAGSGAFEVGMLHIVNDIFEKLYEMPKFPKDIEKKEPFDRKKDIIAKSLYGVEVQGYAVWINQLRLWLTLFIDMPYEMKSSFTPLLPSLNFKIRRGDSLIQRIGSKMFPVHGHAAIAQSVKRKITELKKAKIDFYYNRGKDEAYVRQLENQIFREIILSEIKINEEKLQQRDTKVHTQDALFADDKEAVEKDNKKTISKKAKLDSEITAEIEELKAELRNLRDEHPLIWNIEFSEIFYDKGGFDIIIGNPPYVRQEEIADPEGKVEPKEYKELLREMAALDYPKHFKNRKINGKSDLYTFFYVRGLRLLNKAGVHCFICSNSWLDVGYGVWLQEFLLENVPVNLIIDNHARRSFSGADINTIISLFDAPDKNYDKSNHIVKFVAFKKPFEDAVFTEKLWEIEQAKDIVKNDFFRVYPIAAEKLYDEGWEIEEGAKKETGKYMGDKWGGKYLRAPDIFFTILEKGKGELVKLKDSLGKVDTGLYSGINDFFYLTEVETTKFNIEEQYIIPLVKSPQYVKKIKLNDEVISQRKVFICRKSKKDLEALNHNGALNYINWGETQVTKAKGKVKAGMPWPEVPSVKKRKPGWWSIKDVEETKLFMLYGYNDRFLQPYSDVRALSDRRFHMLRLNYNISHKDAALLLNSTLTCLMIELTGRSNLGEGALDFATMDAQKLLLPSIKILDFSSYDHEPFMSRTVNSIFIECGIDAKSDIPIEEQEPKPLPDRKELDDIVFDAIGLTEEERKDVYRGVCRLVWNRISKAKSVKKGNR